MPDVSLSGLSFLVAASHIGLALKVLSVATSAALIAAGLLSVLLFPLAALTLLRRAGGTASPVPGWSSTGAATAPVPGSDGERFGL